MRERLPWAVLVCLLALRVEAMPVSAEVDAARITREGASGANWFLNGGNAGGAHFSPLASIDAGNVAGLGLDWSVDLPSPDGIAATPLVVDGVIYLSGAHSLVWAIDAASGRQLWSFDPGKRVTPANNWTSRVNRGVALWADAVLVTVSDCRLIALDRATGTQRWSVQTCDPQSGYSITDAPYVGGGKVFVGNAGSESGKRNRGHVSAWDVATGRFLWRFHTVPSHIPAENTSPAMQLAAKSWSGTALETHGGGGSNWNGMTYDPETDRLYFGTAGAVPYLYSERSPAGGDNLFTSSVIALDATTGEYVWHYQTVPQDSWEYNATMNIVLAELPLGGKPAKALMIAPKNGFFYVLDRATGKFVSADHYVKVNWATHIDPETGRPVLDPEAMYWNYPRGSRVAVWPNEWGAHGPQPMAWSPLSGLAYIPAADVPSIVTWNGPDDMGDTMEVPATVDGKPHAPGKLVAWDPLTQRARWIVEQPVAYNGGVLATAGNLVFQGGGDGYFSAYKADDGKRLWQVATGSAISAAPVSYTSGGEQRVLVPVGAGGAMQFSYPALHAASATYPRARLMSFSLSGRQPMPADAPVEAPLAALPARTASPELVARGALLFEAAHCSGCHGKDAVARRGGSVPDLRHLSADTYRQWDGIVVGGARAARGMPAAEGLTPDQSAAIREWVLSRAIELRREHGADADE
jgi:quinohemoprotein ethanol dehydrogenase